MTTSCTKIVTAIFLAALLLIAGCGSGESGGQPRLEKEWNGENDLTVHFINHLDENGEFVPEVTKVGRRFYAAVAAFCEEQEAGWFSDNKKTYRCKGRRSLGKVRKWFDRSEGVYDE